MEKLLEAFHPYIAQHKHFDLVLSKYGPVYVYPVDRQGLLHDAEVLGSLKGIVETVAFQMICDVTEPSRRVVPTKKEIQTVRLRIQGMLAGLDDEPEYMEMLEDYFCHFAAP